MIHALPILILAAVASPSSAGSEAGAVAPANRWTTSGGSLAGTGAAATAPLRGPVEEAWEIEVEGVIEGEPLVWDERVLLSTLKGGDERVLRTLELSSGKESARPYLVRSNRKLEPSLWGNTIAVRRGDRTLEILRWGRSELSRYWRYRAAGEIGPPLLFGSEVYLATTEGLERLTVGRRDPVWRVKGHFRGRPALRGDKLFAVEYDGRGTASITQVDRRTGEVEGRVALGQHVGGVVPDSEGMELSVHARGVYLFSPTPLRIPGADDLRAIGVPRPFPRSGRFELLPGTGSFETNPAEVGPGWIGYLRDAERGRILAHNEQARASQMLVMATGEANREFVRGAAPWTLAQGVAMQGRHAVDTHSGRVLWRLGGGSEHRAVPARGAVLVRDGPRRLIALQEAGDREVEAIVLAKAGVTSARARCVFRDGGVDLGKYHLDPARRRVIEEQGDKQLEIDFESVLLLEDRAGRLLYAAGIEGYLQGLEILAEAEEAQAYARLAEGSRSTNDVGLMSRLMNEAAVRGADDVSLARVRKRIEELEGKEPRISEAQVERIRREEAALSGAGRELYWKRFGALPKDAPLSVRTALLREVLRRGPHAAAAESVRALLPKDVRPEGAFDALDWIEFIEAIHVCPIEIIAMPRHSRRNQSSAERALSRAAKNWRPDLLGFQSEHLLVITPVTRPGAIARCLSMGELVCDALAGLFSTDGALRDPEERLVLHLYETKQEYLDESGGHAGETDIGLEWTAGHYDAQQNLSRIFLPAGKSSFEDVAKTYAHELTHHWLRAQCPRFASAPDPQVELAGYWIVEGFACLVEDFRFDLERRTFDSFDPRSPRLDNVANAHTGQFWPWASLYGLSQLEFQTAPVQGSMPITTTWFLGRRNRMTLRHSFYSQAAATCQYLFHAAGGARRERLLDYLSAYYTGDEAGTDVQRAFGYGPDELAARVREYAKGVVAGRRP